jgi:hypothetical protein
MYGYCSISASALVLNGVQLPGSLKTASQSDSAHAHSSSLACWAALSSPFALQSDLSLSPPFSVVLVGPWSSRPLADGWRPPRPVAARRRACDRRDRGQGHRGGEGESARPPTSTLVRLLHSSSGAVPRSPSSRELGVGTSEGCASRRGAPAEGGNRKTESDVQVKHSYNLV